MKELKQYSPECYFKNPVTGEGGWEIFFPTIPAVNKKHACLIIQNLPYFDCFIDPEFDEIDLLCTKNYTRESLQNLQTGPFARVIKTFYSTKGTLFLEVLNNGLFAVNLDDLNLGSFISIIDADVFYASKTIELK